MLVASQPHNIDDPDGILVLSHEVYRPRQSLTAAIGFDEAGPIAGVGLGSVTVASEDVRPTLVAKSGAGQGS